MMNGLLVISDLLLRNAVGIEVQGSEPVYDFQSFISKEADAFFGGLREVSVWSPS
jgi:hypothetical protein